MTETLSARKRNRACKTDKATGQRNCAAVKVGQPGCPDGLCCGKDRELVDPAILQQREILVRHLRPRLALSPCKQDPETGQFECCNPDRCHQHDACARVWAPAKSYRPSRPRRCRKTCRAAVRCPAGQCFGSFVTVTSEAYLHEFAQIHGREDGAGNFWELAGLQMAGERPHPQRLVERDIMARELRKPGQS